MLKNSAFAEFFHNACVALPGGQNFLIDVFTYAVIYNLP